VRRPVIVIHGGAGPISRANRSREQLERRKAALHEALDAGYRILKSGNSSLDAVAAAVVVLEDSGLFNAGRGGSRNADGKLELDASVMEGASLRAGGVACVSGIRNPVLAARAVMEHSKHVLLAGTGAERFARQHGLAAVPKKYFPVNKATTKRHGTVGAVALDRDGNLAAATSTGGYSGKLPGRVGDSPLIGAGTYADNRSCAVSATGIGEYFIRAVAAYDVAARMRYRKATLSNAASETIKQIEKLHGEGGLIAVDRNGNVAIPFNSQSMYRGVIDRHGRASVAIFR